MSIETGIYIHFKGGRYLVIGTATHTETGEPLVLYEPLSPKGRDGGKKIWARPLEMFLETVEHEGVRVPRFRIVREP